MLQILASSASIIDLPMKYSVFSNDSTWLILYHREKNLGYHDTNSRISCFFLSFLSERDWRRKSGSLCISNFFFFCFTNFIKTFKHHLWRIFEKFEEEFKFSNVIRNVRWSSRFWDDFEFSFHLWYEGALPSFLINIGEFKLMREVECRVCIKGLQDIIKMIMEH